MIEVAHLKKSYRMGQTTVHALRDVSLKIDAGEFVAIMGPSGSGKSTLMHVLGLLDTPDAGSVRLFGNEVAHLKMDELADLRSRSVGFVFQQFNLLPRTSALENVSLPLIYTGREQDPSTAGALLDEVGLGDRKGHKPNELSGGQQQRVAIARALVNNPSLIFADEPTGNLDSQSEKEIMNLFTRLNEKGMTVVLVTHETEIAGYAGRVIRMRDGRIQSDDRNPSRKRPLPSGQTAGRPEKGGRPAGFSYLPEALDHFHQAVRSLLANKIRSILSMLGILIGVTALIAVLALGTGAQKAIEQRLSSLGSNLLMLREGRSRVGGVSQEGNASVRFTPQDANEIQETVPGVRRTAASIDGSAQAVYGNRNIQTRVMGTTPNYAVMRAAEPQIGRFFTEEENLKRTRVAVIGMTPVRELFDGKVPIGEFIKINRINFQVIGVLPEKGSTGWRDQDDIILIPLNTAMKRVFGSDYVRSIDIEVASADRMEETEKAIEDFVRRRHRLPPSQGEEAFRIRNMSEIQEALTDTSRTMTLLLTAIAGISLLVGGIGIMNIMLVSVTERTREIGLRKAIGAKQKDILSQFLIEAVVISLAGGALGVGLGVGVTFAMSAFAGWAATISLQSIGFATLFSLAVGTVFGMWPARKASLLNPIDALRYE